MTTVQVGPLAMHPKRRYRWRMVGRVNCLVVALLFPVVPAGCTAPNPLNCADGICSDKAFPFCDSDGALDGSPDTCIAVSCRSLEFAACRGDQVVACNAEGTDYDLGTCDHGCSEANHGCNECSPSITTCGATTVNHCGANGLPTTPETCQLGCVDGDSPHCAYLEPKYLPDICDAPAALGDFAVSSNGTFDTELDSNCTGGVVPQAGGQSICVVRYATFSIQANKTLKVVSSSIDPAASRAVAIVADGAVTIDGVLDISADGMTSGPGGGTVPSGGGQSSSAGAGGAGGKTAGGAGGNATTDGGAANGGAASLNPALLSALVGGARAAGGGGGGAAMLISCRGTVSVHGMVDAGGGGGSLYFFGAPGGGSGGNVIMQGMAVTVTGEVYANGGGGGAGLAAGQMLGANGEDGSRSDVSPAAGGFAQTGAGRGGTGGYVRGNPGNGLAPTASGAKAGGGGGSMGYFQTYTPMTVTPTLSPTHASPMFEPNGTIRTR